MTLRSLAPEASASAIPPLAQKNFEHQPYKSFTSLATPVLTFWLVLVAYPVS